MLQSFNTIHTYGGQVVWKKWELFIILLANSNRIKSFGAGEFVGLSG